MRRSPPSLTLGIAGLNARWKPVALLLRTMLSEVALFRGPDGAAPL